MSGNTTAAGPPRAALLGLYKRLRIAGETPQMLRRTSAGYDIPTIVRSGRNLLAIHRELQMTEVKRTALRAWHVKAKLTLSLKRRWLLARLLKNRLQLRSTMAIANLLSTLTILAVVVCSYTLYRVFRIGMNGSQERFAAASAPVLTTLNAMAEAEEARKQRLRDQMEVDVLRTR